jgi:hypothetical protein
MMAASQFDIARKRAEQQSRASVQGQQEALKRRFASMGAAGSGAALKQEQLAAEKGQEQLGQQMEAIGAAEQQETERKAEVQQAQQYQSGEAEKARQFAIAERQAGEQFQSANTAKTQAFQERVQAWNESQAGKEMDMALQQFNQDKETTEFNRRLSIATAAREGIGIEELTPMAPSAAGGMAAAPQAEPTLSSSSSKLIKRYQSPLQKPSEKELRTARAKMSPAERALFDRQIKSINKSRQEYEASQGGGA